MIGKTYPELYSAREHKMKKKDNTYLQSYGLFLSLIMVTLLNLASHVLSLDIGEVSFAGLTMAFSEFKSISGVVLGVLVALLSFIISIPANILTKKLIRQKYPKEIFQNSFYPLFLFATCAQFFISWTVGKTIIPCVAFFNYLPHNVLTYFSLLLFVIFEIIAFYLFLIFQYYAIVLTDTQIIGVSFCSSLRGEQVFLKDIKTISPMWNGYKITAKNGNILILRMRPFATKIYERLKELLNMEKK